MDRGPNEVSSRGKKEVDGSKNSSKMEGNTKGWNLLSAMVVQKDL